MMGTYDYKSCKVDKLSAKENKKLFNLLYSDDNIYPLQQVLHKQRHVGGNHDNSWPCLL